MKLAMLFFCSSFTKTVTLDNLEEYIELVTDFCLNVGIRRQLESFRGQ
jgi:hypothetical protein